MKKYLIVSILTACISFGLWKGCTKNKKFDSHQWKYSHEGLGYFYPHREEMLQDLTKGEHLKYLHKNEIIEILGNPDFQSDNSENELIYKISEEWDNFAPEPVYSKNLLILLDNELVFKDYKIQEWER